MNPVTHIVVERIVDCPFSVAHEYAEDYLRGEQREVAVSVPVRDFLRVVGGKPRKPVKLVFTLHPDETDSGRLHDALLIEWHAGTRLFPDFHGTLRLRIASITATRLTFEGGYRPPLGAPGRLFDALIGRRIARATLHGLLKRIGDALEAREAAFCAEMAARAASGSNV